MNLARPKKIATTIVLAGWASVACAAETSPFGTLLPPEATYRLHAPVEFRFGAFDHEPNMKTYEGNTTDLSGDLIFGGVGGSSNDWSIVRAHVGGTYNLNGKTDGIYSGLVFTGAIYDKFFIEGSIDGAWNNGLTGGVKPAANLHRDGTGCHFGFHESASLGYNLTEHWSVMFTAEHYSNLQLCLRNHGISNYGAKIGYTF